MQRQWVQIILFWTLAAAAGILALANLSGEKLYLSFSAIAASAIALVSLEHLITFRTSNTVRQQVYVVAGVLLILGNLTLVSLAS